MPTRSITVSLSSIGTSAGPFNISDDVLGVIAMNVTRAQLLSGYVVNSDVNATVVTVTSIGTCTTSLNIYLSTPTPTPTPTITPTPTVTPTPTQNPIYFDSNFTGNSNICGAGGKMWSRLTAPSGTLVQVTVDVDQFVTSITAGSTSACILGELYETSLPSLTPPSTTLITAASSSVLAAGIPTYLTDSKVTSFTIPASGYKDILIKYTTKNLGSNFSNGSARATITAVNGVSVVEGGSIYSSYNCSDTGSC